MNQTVKNWTNFANKVKEHIETYVQKQYGNSIDSGDDLVTKNGAEYCIEQIKRYCDRFGSSARGNIEQERDILKIAHYAQLAHTQYTTNLSQEDILLNKCIELAKDVGVFLLQSETKILVKLNNNIELYKYTLATENELLLQTNDLYEVSNHLNLMLLGLENE
jgi:hypothetical protein